MAQATTAALDEHTASGPRPPGERYDVGGYRLHLQRRGRGGPAAVFDAGLSANSLIYTNSLAAIAPHAEAVAYDRAGYAWSDPAPGRGPRLSRQMVAELRTLLRCAGLQPPYILLGHSFGAINMLVYAHTYPAEVAGLVLVDPSHPEMFTRVRGIPSGRAMARMYGTLGALGRLGLLRWLGPLLLRQLVPDGERVFPPETWQSLLYFARRPQDYATTVREASASVENFAAARGAPGSLGAMPLEVLSAEWWVTSKPSELKRGMLGLVKEMAGYSTRGRHTLVPGCDHSTLPIVRPDAVAEAVRRVLEASATA